MALPGEDAEPKLICPWRRYFARTLDFVLCEMLLLTPIMLLFRPNVELSGFGVSVALIAGAMLLMLLLEPLCLHDSTLSFATHALFAAQNGLEGAAVRYFDKALWLDLRDVMGNTGKEGLHLACLGETWQAAVFGFAGLRLENGRPALSPHLPAAFDGYRIAHISDLHLGTYGRDTAFVHRFVGRVNALRPDAVLFTGDLVNVSAAEAEPYVGLLARLSAPDGVTSVLGNHDYCEYGRYATRDGALRQRDMVVEYEREMGWQLLRDSSVVVRRGADSIALIGVENTGRPPFPARGNLKKAMCGLQEGIFKILLTHDPSHWRSEVLPATDIDLTLSGHTHAVQLRIGGFSPARWVYPEWGGLYVEGGRALHVSVGVGGTVPFRLGAWPEIDIVTLRRGGV